MKKPAAIVAIMLIGFSESACSKSDSGSSSSADSGIQGSGGVDAQSGAGGTAASAGVSSGGAASGGASGTAGASGSGGAGGNTATGGGTNTGGIATGGTAGNGGTSTGGVAAGGNAGSGGTLSGYIACSDPEPLLISSQDTGFVRCANSAVLHRAQIIDCPNLLPRAGGGACSALGTATEPCAQDSDCTAAPLGFCTEVPSHYPGCGCVYGCVSDLDCGVGKICECSDPIGVCRPASCISDQDCASGSLCASAALGWGGCSWSPPERGYQCQSLADTCLTDAECITPTPACALEQDAGVRACHEGQLACP